MSPNAIDKMNTILKITHHTKNQENHNLSEIKHSIDTITDLSPMLDLSDKDF